MQRGIRMKKIIVCIVLVLAFFGCESKEGTVEIKPYKVGDIITLKGVEGGEKKLKRIKGGFEIMGDEKSILMFDIFGTFCPPCQSEATNLTALQVKYAGKLSIIGLTYLEDVDDKYVVENFSDKYNAHYFISNSPKNARIVETIVADIGYPRAVQLPFKVVLKNGKYQILKDVWEGKSDTKFYLGDVGIKTIEEDLRKILGSK